jgi:hypothetical protein
MPEPLSQRELDVFAEIGLVTIDTPFSNEILESARGVIAGLFEREEGVTGSWIVDSIHDPTLIAIMVDPFFERLAQRVLRTDDVRLASYGIRRTFGRPDAEPRLEDEHIDLRCTREDLNASPAGFLCGGVLWLTDVTMENNPLYFRPGSHLLVARHTEQYPEMNTGEYQQKPPDLEYQDLVPVLAKAGQYSLFGGPVVHAGSVTRGPNSERIAFFIEYKATAADFKFYIQEQDEMWSFIRAMRPLVPEDRRHVIPSE